MMRGGCASRSTTLTVSTLPSEPAALPLSAVSAILPPGATATLKGHNPVGKSSLPSTSSSDTWCAGNLVAKARLPSGVKVAWETLSPIATVSISLTAVPLIESTLIDLSSRLAKSASVPAGLMLSPEGCLPTVTMPIALGGSALRSMTWTLSSGTCFRLAPSLITSTESATSASVPVG